MLPRQTSQLLSLLYQSDWHYYVYYITFKALLEKTAKYFYVHKTIFIWNYASLNNMFAKYYNPTVYSIVSDFTNIYIYIYITHICYPYFKISYRWAYLILVDNFITSLYIRLYLIFRTLFWSLKRKIEAIKLIWSLYVTLMIVYFMALTCYSKIVGNGVEYEIQFFMFLSLLVDRNACEKRWCWKISGVFLILANMWGPFLHTFILRAKYAMVEDFIVNFV